MNIDMVLAQLSSYKLTCTAADVELVESDKDGGTIVWQSLTAGSQVEEWSTIKFRVSSGLAASQLAVSIELPQNGSDVVTGGGAMWGKSRPRSTARWCALRSGIISPTLSGSGMKMVRVYFDDVLDQSQSYARKFS